MHENDRVAIEARLEGKRGGESWTSLCELFGRADWEKKPGSWVPEASELLAGRLPDEDRTWPTDWLTRKRPPAATALVRHLRVYQGTDAAHRRQLAQLATLDARTMPPLGVFTYQPYSRTLRELSDDDATMLVQRLAWTPLHTLRLAGDATPGSLLQALGRDVSIPSLRSLHVSTRLDDAPLAALLGAPLGRGLRELVLEDWPRLGPRATAPLAALSPHLERLSLALVLDDPIVVEALGHGDWPALRHLALNRHRADVASELGPLLDRAPGLTSLDLSTHRFPASLGRLLAGRRAPRLERLDLAYNEMPADALASALSAPMLEGLRELDITRNHADAASARAVARMPLRRLGAVLVTDPAFWQGLAGRRMEDLDTITLGGDPADSGVMLEALAAMELPSLRTLGLARARLTHADLDRLERAPWFPQLRSLIDGWETTQWVMPTWGDGSVSARFAALHWAIFQP